MFDPDFISSFWRAKAQSGSTRWTSSEMLEYEVGYLKPLVSDSAVILDLGSGFGELSRAVCPVRGRIVAVDQEPLFAEPFVQDSRYEFHNSRVENFDTDINFDLALLFGVVTHLSEEQELSVYGILKKLIAGGICVIKNQCSIENEIFVDRFSERLNSKYQGRYPSVEDQAQRLGRYFSSIETIKYPHYFNDHADTQHVAFICRVDPSNES